MSKAERLRWAANEATKIEEELEALMDARLYLDTLSLYYTESTDAISNAVREIEEAESFLNSRLTGL